MSDMKIQDKAKTMIAAVRMHGQRAVATMLVFVSAFLMFSSRGADTSQGILKPNFQTLIVQKENNFLSPPVIQLGSGERIVISFDEIGEDWSRLQYRLVHCNADWQPSRLIESEYVDGFNFADIDDYAFSSNTFTNYVNYRFTLPNEHLQVLRSGNYVVEVFPQEDPDDVILRARFQVSEDTTYVNGRVTSRTDKGYNTEWQQIELAVNTGDRQINPYNEILVSVVQNRRPDTEVFVNHPMRVENGRIIYEHIWDLIFPASNEYRRFETVREDYPGMGIDHIDFADRRYQAWLFTDQDRASSEYYYDQTQKGRFMIDSYSSTDPDLGADYVDVHFTLDHPQLMNGDIYVNGDFTSNRYDPRYKMRYVPEYGVYTLTLPLKQGSYNYQYVAVKDGEKKGTTALIEGDKFETQNEYTVSVYYRTPTGRADRLIGSATLYAVP